MEKERGGRKEIEKIDRSNDLQVTQTASKVNDERRTIRCMCHTVVVRWSPFIIIKNRNVFSDGLFECSAVSLFEGRKVNKSQIESCKAASGALPRPCTVWVVVAVGIYFSLSLSSVRLMCNSCRPSATQLTVSLRSTAASM